MDEVLLVILKVQRNEQFCKMFVMYNLWTKVKVLQREKKTNKKILKHPKYLTAEYCCNPVTTTVVNDQHSGGLLVYVGSSSRLLT